MEYICVFQPFRQSGDDIASSRGPGIILRRHHHAERGLPVPFHTYLVQCAVDRVFDNISEVTLQAQHYGLGLGIAHAAVEFKNLDAAVRRDHQSGIQESGIGDAFCRHAAHDRLDHFAQRARMELGRDHGRGRIRTHAAGVRALVAVQQSFVVLAGRHRQHILAVHHHDETGFFAGEEFLDHHTRAGIAELVVRQHHVDRGECFFFCHRHHHALACGEAVRLDDDRCAMLFDIGLCRAGVAESFEERSGDVVSHHETLGEVLGGFKLCGSPGRAEDLQSRGAEFIDDTRRQRRFRADYRHIDVFALRE